MQAVLFNSAPLTGTTVAYPIAAVAVTDYDLASGGDSVLRDVSGSPALSCAFAALPQSVLASHTDCSLMMGAEQTVGANGLTLEVSFDSGAPLVVEVPLSVYAISTMTIQALARSSATHLAWPQKLCIMTTLVPARNSATHLWKEPITPHTLNLIIIFSTATHYMCLSTFKYVRT